jgi:hypothetical protein
MKPILRILYILIRCIANILFFVLGIFEIIFMLIFAPVSYIFTGKSNVHLYLERAENLNNTLDEFITKFDPDK